MLSPEQLDELEALAKAATPGPWRVSNSIYNAVVCDPHHARLIGGAEDVVHYGGGLVGESIQANDQAYIAALSPTVALELIDALRPRVTHLTKEEARVIRTWRCELDCSWGRVAELADQVFGNENRGQLDGERLCREAATLLGEDPYSGPWG